MIDRPTAPARRRWLALALRVLAAAGAAPACGWPALARGAAPLRIALGWDEPAAQAGGERVRCIGVWRAAAGPGECRFEIESRRVVPTRAHGLARLPSGELLAVARRPGLWLQRWSVDGRLQREAWAEPGRQFNGHLLPSADGRLIFSTEQSDEEGAGCVALRDARTLALADEWPTGGTDPHQLLRVGDTLYVANGGVPTRPETGRAKRALSAMDSSLAAFDLRSGRRSGTWRLDDPRLSLRHLAWHAGSATLGIALQAEHDDAAERARAPLLALFDGRALRTVAPPPQRPDQGAGYAGDIAATADGFAVSAPKAGRSPSLPPRGLEELGSGPPFLESVTRAGAVLRWSGWQGWQAPVPLAEAGAFAPGGDGAPLAALGAEQALAGAEPGQALALPPGCRPDNHALCLPAGATW